MELYFLILLILIMVLALSSGFPVAYALPGAAITTIALASLCGYLFAGDTDAYFVSGGPNQWLSAGVTNFRSLYWVVERDTLIAIPLFIFMGIMLQRSKIAEDLLVAMAQLFGPVPGGLGISVVFVGALLAATTGIVGATVIAMGLISLPAMLRNRYDKSLACGTICASGTLGQIIPPSIVLIILADQLSSAADQAATARKAEYREITGEYAMPGNFDVVSASAGDMFMGAFIPGLILVGLYMLYILITALINPRKAPPVPFHGAYDRQFIINILFALIPPLALIFMVLGSIVFGVATVNQAGAIGAIGAMLMGSYRLMAGKPRAYWPAAIAIVSVIAIIILLNFFDLNIKNIQNSRDAIGVALACIASLALFIAVGWAVMRAYRIDETLQSVMLETAKTTSMVFIILIGAAMLTSAFRAFGGEELVKEHLTSLPGGFWTQFIVVMLVIFLLGFFLDFLEIAVVVVPIVAPILLADPEANITAVWFGVMVGLNIQTSFLTPPFGFSLFYLRGVAPAIIRTAQIYKGASAFIGLQLLGLVIAGTFPSLVNYLPNKAHLISDTAPPPSNPKLQECLEDYIFTEYDKQRSHIEASIERIKIANISYFPDTYQDQLNTSYARAEQTFAMVEAVQSTAHQLQTYAIEYRPLHIEVRQIQKEARRLDKKIEILEDDLRRLNFSETIDDHAIIQIKAEIAELQKQQAAWLAQIPVHWQPAHEKFKALATATTRARQDYRLNVDESYQTIMTMKQLLSQTGQLEKLNAKILPLIPVIKTQPPKAAMQAIKSVRADFDTVIEINRVKSLLSKARRALRGNNPDQDKAISWINQASAQMKAEMKWQSRAAAEFSADLKAYDKAIARTIGMRLQERLTNHQAESIAGCLAVHRDLSLYF